MTMEKPPAKQGRGKGRGRGRRRRGGEGGGEEGLGFSSITEDIFIDILARLPSSSFASAACVNRSWNHVCNHILTRPKLLSALSLNPNHEIAVNEVIDKVLAEPIRPHFVIASVGKDFDLTKICRLIKSRLGSKIPIIVSEAYGIIGNDAITNGYKEVKWRHIDDCDMEPHSSSKNTKCGIVLTLGYFPGMKVAAIPLMPAQERSYDMCPIDEFITDIKDYSASKSGCTAPVGIIMFS
ncbi:F-box domain containing protein, partial [Thalictrum thalictroides]